MKIRKRVLACLLFFLLCSPLFSQTITRTKSIETDHSIVTASIDRRGEFVIADEQGNIDKYSRNGDLLYHFSPSKPGIPWLAEAWQGLRIFVFYEEFQEFLFLNRFMDAPDRFQIGNTLSQFISAATPTNDGHLWLIDAQQPALLKYNLEFNQVTISTPLTAVLPAESVFEPSFIRAYQNLLFVSDKSSGIFVFDNLGNYLETMEHSGSGFFSFSANELVELSADGKSVLLRNIYSKKQREIGFPDLSYDMVLKDNNQLIAIKNNLIHFYTIN